MYVTTVRGGFGQHRSLDKAGGGGTVQACQEEKCDRAHQLDRSGLGRRGPMESMSVEMCRRWHAEEGTRMLLAAMAVGGYCNGAA